MCVCMYVGCYDQPFGPGTLYSIPPKTTTTTTTTTTASAAAAAAAEADEEAEADEAEEEEEEEGGEEEKKQRQQKKKKKKKRELFDFARGFVSQSPSDEAQANFLSRLEAIFVQYLGLVCFPECIYIHSAVHAGPGQISFGDYRLDLIDATVVKAPGRISYINFHERNVHYKGHFKSPRQPLGCSGTFPCRQAGEENDFYVFSSTSSKDEIKADYCAAINETASKMDYDLEFEYLPVFECQIFHDNNNNNKQQLSAYLQTTFPKQFLPSQPKHVTYKDMLHKLITEKSVGGFAVITGGRDGGPGRELFGYCVTKQFPDPSEIGEYSADLIKSMGVKNLDAFCKKTPLTVPRSNFLDTSYEVVAISYLRWLIENRKLHDFKIVHVLAYTELPLLKNFLDKLLQFRYDIKQKRVAGSSLQSLTCKLFCNGYYGYSSMYLPKYPVTRIVGEHTLRHPGKNCGIKDSKILNVVCMGCRKVKPPARVLKRKNKAMKRRKTLSREQENDYELIYAVTQHNKDCKIENVAQVCR